MPIRPEYPGAFSYGDNVPIPGSKLIDLGLLYDNRAPLSLDVKDAFEVYHTSGNPILANRVFYLPGYNCYVVHDKETPNWFYLVDGTTKKSIAAFIVNLDYTGYTDCLDMAIAYPRDDIRLTAMFLLANKEKRCMAVVGYELDMREFFNVSGRQTTTYTEQLVTTSIVPVDLYTDSIAMNGSSVESDLTTWELVAGIGPKVGTKCGVGIPPLWRRTKTAFAGNFTFEISAKSETNSGDAIFVVLAAVPNPSQPYKMDYIAAVRTNGDMANPMQTSSLQKWCILTYVGDTYRFITDATSVCSDPLASWNTYTVGTKFQVKRLGNVIHASVSLQPDEDAVEASTDISIDLSALDPALYSHFLGPVFVGFGACEQPNTTFYNGSYTRLEQVITGVPISLSSYVSRWDTTAEPIILGEKDMRVFHEIISQGLTDTIAMGFVTKKTDYTDAADIARSVYYPVPNFPAFCEQMNRMVTIGEFDYRYCSMTSSPQGRLYILAQGRVKLWLGPFLETEFDAQYLIVTNWDGTPIKYILNGPGERLLQFDEDTADQPYARWLNIIDGADLIMVEDRKSRDLYLNYSKVGNPVDFFYVPPYGRNWFGGWVAGAWFDALAGSYSSGGGTVSWLGYPDAWSPLANAEVKQKEIVWTRCSTKGILNTFPLGSLKDRRPIQLIPEHNSVESATISHSLHFIYQQGRVIYHCKFNYLAVFFGDPSNSDCPMSTIYIPSLDPGVTYTETYYMVNLADRGEARHITMSIDPSVGAPEGLSIGFQGLPDTLAPGGSAAFTVTARYDPPNGAQPFSTAVMPLRIECLMRFDIA